MKLRLVCRVFGHAPAVPVTGRVGATKAIALVCARCRTVLSLRPASRADRRRAMFGRPMEAKKELAR